MSLTLQEDFGESTEEKNRGNAGGHQVGNGLGEEGGLGRNKGGQQNEGQEIEAFPEEGAKERQTQMPQGGGLVHCRPPP